MLLGCSRCSKTGAERATGPAQAPQLTVKLHVWHLSLHQHHQTRSPAMPDAAPGSPKRRAGNSDSKLRSFFLLKAQNEWPSVTDLTGRHSLCECCSERRLKAFSECPKESPPRKAGRFIVYVTSPLKVRARAPPGLRSQDTDLPPQKQYFSS